MKKYVLSGILIIIETLIFYFLATYLDMENKTICRLLITLLLFLFVFDHYKITSKLVWDEMKSLGKAMVCFFVVETVMLSAMNTKGWFIDGIILTIVMYIVAIFFDRSLRILFRPIVASRTLVIGIGDDAARLGRIANNNRFALTKVVGYVRYEREQISEDLMERYENGLKSGTNFKIFESVENEKVLEKEDIEQVIIAIPHVSKEEINQLMLRLYNRVKVIKYVPNVNVTMTFNSKIQDFDGILLISTAQGTLGFIGRLIKRIIDIVAALFGIVLLAPIALYVRHKNRKNGDYDSIIFKQDRIGLNGKPIKIYKFRTMIPNAEQVLEELMEKDPEIKKEYLTNKKLQNDPRITEAGHFLRKSSLDEFPQFINVLKGEMSLVGPRPYLFREKEDMGIYYDSVIHCKPGITGMWQANGRSDVGFEDRCKLDDYYYKNWTLSLDMIIIYKTVKSVVYGKGAL